MVGVVGGSSRIMITLSREEFDSLQTMIVVEMWDKRKFGRVKRAWLKTFNEEERRKASDLYIKIYKYNMVTGTPEKVIMSTSTIAFLKRLVEFFATV